MNRNAVTCNDGAWAIRLCLIVAAGFGLVACGSGDNGQADMSATNRASDADIDDGDMAGEAAYNLVCSACHESGEQGAPAIGDREAWADRSPLWEAVLVEHAKNGYLDMPSRGGAEDMPDSVVSRATEYMMLLVYPDRPPDN